MNPLELEIELMIHCVKMSQKCDNCVFSQHRKMHPLGLGCLAQSPLIDKDRLEETFYYIVAELIYSEI